MALVTQEQSSARQYERLQSRARSLHGACVAMRARNPGVPTHELFEEFDGILLQSRRLFTQVGDTAGITEYAAAQNASVVGYNIRPDITAANKAIDDVRGWIAQIPVNSEGFPNLSKLVGDNVVHAETDITEMVPFLSALEPLLVDPNVTL
jgi:hypothetical protein